MFLVICNDGTTYRVEAEYFRWTSESGVVKLMKDIETTVAIVSMENVRMVVREDTLRCCDTGGCSCVVGGK